MQKALGVSKMIMLHSRFQKRFSFTTFNLCVEQNTFRRTLDYRLGLQGFSTSSTSGRDDGTKDKEEVEKRRGNPDEDGSESLIKEQSGRPLGDSEGRLKQKTNEHKPPFTTHKRQETTKNKDSRSGKIDRSSTKSRQDDEDSLEVEHTKGTRAASMNENTKSASEISKHFESGENQERPASFYKNPKRYENQVKAEWRSRFTGSAAPSENDDQDWPTELQGGSETDTARGRRGSPRSAAFRRIPRKEQTEDSDEYSSQAQEDDFDFKYPRNPQTRKQFTVYNDPNVSSTIASLTSQKPYRVGQVYDPVALVSGQDPFSSEGPTVRPFLRRQPKPHRLVQTGREIHPLNTWFLSRFIAPTGKIMPRRQTGLSAKKQRKLSKAIKLARHLGFLPYLDNYNPAVESERQLTPYKRVVHYPPMRPPYFTKELVELPTLSTSGTDQTPKDPVSKSMTELSEGEITRGSEASPATN